MISQKLAIHAKRQTVMNKDIHCLRDLWYSIDPTSHIGSSNGHQRLVWENKRKFDRKLVDVDSLVRKAQTGVVSRPHRR